MLSHQIEQVLVQALVEPLQTLQGPWLGGNHRSHATIGAALAGMVCNLTTGKKKYAKYAANDLEFKKLANDATFRIITGQ